MTVLNETLIKIETTTAILDMLDKIKPDSVRQARALIVSFRQGLEGAADDLLHGPDIDAIVARGSLPQLDDVICDILPTDREAKRGTFRCGTGEKIDTGEE